ncbi:pre-toxin TG domain-containing protein, partial [Chitinimonas sp. BJB300]
HRREIAEAAKASDALRQIDQLSDASQGMQRLTAMQKTDNALLAGQQRITNLKQEARTLGQFAKNHCQGLSDAQCAGKLDTALKSNTQLGVALATMTPLVGEADSIKTVLTGTDLNGEEASRLLGVLGVLTGGAAQKVGKGIGAAIDAGKTVDKVGEAGRIVAHEADNVSSTAKATRSVDDLLPNGKVPSTRGGEFSRWFDELSDVELNTLWENKTIRESIETRIRQPGGLHEWCMVCRAPEFKSWGVSMDEIQRFRTKTTELKWTSPIDGKHGGHGAHASGAFHNELKAVIDNSKSLDDFNSGIIRLRDRWKIDPNLLPSLPRKR